MKLIFNSLSKWEFQISEIWAYKSWTEFHFYNEIHSILLKKKKKKKNIYLEYNLGVLDFGMFILFPNFKCLAVITITFNWDTSEYTIHIPVNPLPLLLLHKVTKMIPTTICWDDAVEKRRVPQEVGPLDSNWISDRHMHIHMHVTPKVMPIYFYGNYNRYQES